MWKFNDGVLVKANMYAYVHGVFNRPIEVLELLTRGLLSVSVSVVDAIIKQDRVYTATP